MILSFTTNCIVLVMGTDSYQCKNAEMELKCGGLQIVSLNITHILINLIVIISVK